MADYRETIAGITGADANAHAEASSYIDTLIKPLGSLGQLEEIAARLAGMTGQMRNQVDKRATVVMAADNGVFEEGVASSPQEYTRLQAVNMTKGICGISVLSKVAGADVFVVDVGIKDDPDCSDILARNVMRSTANMAIGPAMQRETAEEAIGVGIDIATDLFGQGYEILGTGEMGIGNTTSTSACLVGLTGADVKEAVGRGAGLTDEALAGKVEVVKKALVVNAPNPDDPIDVLAKVGGLDIAGLTGCYLAAARCRKPILIDGTISAIAALIAMRLAPAAKDFMFATHSSLEPSFQLIIDTIGLKPILYMDMRLGEGSGCALAFPIVAAACAMINSMGTFEENL